MVRAARAPSIPPAHETPPQCDVYAPVALRAEDGRFSATAVEAVSVLMTDLVGSTAMAGCVGPATAEELRQGALWAAARGVRAHGRGVANFTANLRRH